MVKNDLDDDARSSFNLRAFSIRSSNSEDMMRMNDERAQETLERTRVGLQAARRRNTQELEHEMDS